MTNVFNKIFSRWRHRRQKFFGDRVCHCRRCFDDAGDSSRDPRPMIHPSKKRYLLDYIRQRRYLFVTYVDYATLVRRLERNAYDFDEQRFVDSVRRYVLLSQRFLRCPDSNKTTGVECDLAYREIHRSMI